MVLTGCRVLLRRNAKNGKKQLFVPLITITVAKNIWNKVLWKKLKANGPAIRLRFGGKKDVLRKPHKQTYTVLLVVIL